MMIRNWYRRGEHLGHHDAISESSYAQPDRCFVYGIFQAEARWTVQPQSASDVSQASGAAGIACYMRTTFAPSVAPFLK